MPTLTFLSYEADGGGAVLRPLQNKVGESISVLDYGAAGDGVTDDSAAIQKALDANKGGTIVLPAPHTFLAAGIALSGSSYHGTRVIVEGVFKLKASGGAKNFDVSGSPIWGGFIIHDVDRWHFEAPGWLDGNRANQPNDDINDQQHILLQVRGGHNWTTGLIRGREVRGDVMCVTTRTNVAPYVLADNPSGFFIGPILAVNSADDGRNALSLTSGRDGRVAGGVSINVGGLIDGNPMPGGFDMEGDGNWHRIDNVEVGPWHIVTSGTSGFAIVGHPITNDAARDWTNTNIRCADFTVIASANTACQPVFERVRGLKVSGTYVRRGTRGNGVHLDYADQVKASFEVSGVTNGVFVGRLDTVQYFDIEVRVRDYQGYGLICSGAAHGRFTGFAVGAVAGPGGEVNGVGAVVGPRTSVTQTGVTYSVSVPQNGNNFAAFLTNVGMTFTNCAIQDCAFDGYANFTSMVISPVPIPSMNVRGRNRAAAIPTTGHWMLGDYIQNVNPSIGSGKVLLGWSRLTSGSAHVVGTDWTPIYGTTS